MNKSAQLLSGRTLPTLLSFAVPIILGNIFQQLYNIVDAMVVGKYLGELPLGGISIASPVMDLLYALLLGGTVGIGVLIGQLCGARDWAKLRRVHATALLGGSAFTLALSALGLAFSRRILLVQGYGDAYCDQAMAYLRVILGGLIFCFLYNYFASALRSYGNSRTPFVVLLVSSSVHALLDVLLVGVWRLGIYGVACSTVFCQMLASVWLIVYTVRRCPEFALRRADYRVDGEMARTILAYAWAAALQQAVVCLGKLLVQGFLTPLGEQSVTGYNMGVRWENFMFCFSQGVSASLVVCIAQNLGQGNRDRVRKFYYAGLAVEFGMALALAALCKVFPQQIIALFTDSAGVIAAGATYTGTMAFIYIFSFFGEVIQGFFRGLGRLRLTMVASLLQIVLRVILSYLLIPRLHMVGICLAISVGWALLVLIEGGYSIKTAERLRVKT